MQQPDPHPTDPQARFRLTCHVALQKPCITLVHTLPHAERRAQLHLGAQGLRTHFPTIQKTIRHARQLRAVQAPLFPRYIFVILDLGRGRWLSVRGTVGVSSPFSSEDRPVPVPEGIVETLIQNSDEANLAL